MFFQALVRRQRYWLALGAIALALFCSLPVFAGFPWTSNRTYYSASPTKTIIAERTLSVNSPNEPGRLFQQLGLTDEQQKQIKQVHLQYRHKIIQKQEKISKLQRQLSDMMVGTEAVELLRAKNQQLSNLRQEIESLHFESMLATREILTPQQRQKFREFVKDSALVQ